MPTLKHAQFLEADRQRRDALRASGNPEIFGALAPAACPIPRCCREHPALCARCYRCEACCRCDGGPQDAGPDGFEPRKRG